MTVFAGFGKTTVFVGQMLGSDSLQSSTVSGSHRLTVGGWCASLYGEKGDHVIFFLSRVQMGDGGASPLS